MDMETESDDILDYNDFLFAFPRYQNPSKIGSTPKGKNLLLGEQILSFKSLPLLKREAKWK